MLGDRADTGAGFNDVVRRPYGGRFDEQLELCRVGEEMLVEIWICRYVEPVACGYRSSCSGIGAPQLEL